MSLYATWYWNKRISEHDKFYKWLDVKYICCLRCSNDVYKPDLCYWGACRSTRRGIARASNLQLHKKNNCLISAGKVKQNLFNRSNFAQLECLTATRATSLPMLLIHLYDWKNTYEYWTCYLQNHWEYLLALISFKLHQMPNG